MWPAMDRWAGRAGEGRLAAQHLVEHAAEAVDVGAGVELASAGGLLRAHVGRRSDRAARSRSSVSPLAAVERPRDAEVRDTRAVAAVEQDVLRLDVAMD